ncbi:putative methyltransferase [Candidatus Sulfobium mesophilum]|uniref:Putative methyltransferase n=1 Tax=Candidatus Sulfobium mesophilum TaxID=2016548 RepID=A0A2U3QEQ3_9BACT|nr:putative methyltransferase [Candidatus Sulfobium mesophilum]
MFAKFMKAMVRKKAPVNFPDMARVVPIDPNFAWDRGTPIDRYYIESFFRRNARLITGRVLEVGGSTYSRRFSEGKAESYSVLDVAPNNDKTTIVGDLADKSSLPANAFDCFICAQTFQYIFEVREAVEGAHHLLKPGGVLLATVPGISQISRKDSERYGEYWRFTKDSIDRLFRPVFAAGVEVSSFGNVLSATAFLQGVALEDLPDSSLLDAVDNYYQMIITVIARKG